MILLRLLVMRSTSHLSRLNDICQVSSQFCRASMSSWSLVALASDLMCLYRRQSSGNSFALDVTQCGMSFMVNVRTTQKSIHNQNHLTLTQRQQAKPLGWIKTPQRCVSYSDESCFPLYLSDGRVASRDITLDRTWSITLLESTNYNMYCIDI